MSKGENKAQDRFNEFLRNYCISNDANIEVYKLIHENELLKEQTAEAKRVACDFAEWCSINEWVYYSLLGYWRLCGHIKTTSDLYDLFTTKTKSDESK